ncbi:MAG TPA: NADH-quinone oxidoreductase subunit C, partial [Tepidiformaceae bacterium]|nr:NADH-quinone oxidoreductase subunit C [Tepidiformaceae bacterium]
MPKLADLLRNGKLVEAHRPWPRVIVTAEAWHGIANELAGGRAILLGLWGDNVPAVHIAIMSEDTRQIAVVTIDCPSGSFPSVGAVHPPAIRLERAIFSLYGLEPVGAPDARPWLDLGFWDVRYPLGARSPAPATP